MPSYADAYDFMMCEPPDNSVEEAAAERDYQERLENYVDDWCRGTLPTTPYSGDPYYDPIERLTEDDWLVHVLAAKDDEQLLAAAKIVQAKLRQFVEEQAEDMG